MSKQANLKNQEKLKLYLKKNESDTKSNNNTNQRVRNESSAVKHSTVRGVRRKTG